MPFKAVEDDVDDTQLLFFKKDPETEEDVRLKVRPVPAPWLRMLRHRVAKGLTTARAAKEEVNKVVDRQDQFNFAKAGYALVDSVNFVVSIKGTKTAEALSTALGSPVAPGDVSLDGRWNDEVKELIFAMWPEMAYWLCTQADKLARLEGEEEDELGKT